MFFPTRRVAVAAVLLTLLLAAVIACAPSAEPAAQTDPSASSASSGEPTADQASATDAPAAAGSSATASSTGSEADRPTEAPAASQPTTAPAVSAPVNLDVPNIEGIDAWLNTDMELQIADLTSQGKVVLIDFWTYTCYPSCGSGGRATRTTGW